MANLLEQRRLDTTKRITQLKKELDDAEKLCADTACVYATGSFARGEASIHSDLDLFIVSKGEAEKPTLRKLDEILIKADLIDATRKFGILDFSGDGAYLSHYSVSELKNRLGTQEDDVNNTFTARLLLLLESIPLLGRSAYRDITEDVIAAYWKDYQGHKNDFMPAFLANDILRMWRTFCVNYEAKTQSAPPERMAKRRLKNYKLKHSRLLTCYSALLYLLAVYSKNNTVGPSDAAHMISLTPTLRLEWLLLQPNIEGAHDTIKRLLGGYEDFLRLTDASEADLIGRFLDKDQSSRYFESASKFGDLVFEVLEAIGKDNRFYRLLVV